MKRSPSIKTLIKDLEPHELREVILELCELSEKNRQFLKLFLQCSDAVDVESIVKEAKKKIYGHFYGRAMFPKIDLPAARKAVNEYSKVLKEYPGQIADLKLYYVEVGTELTNDFGDVNDRFYSSMVSMFNSFCEQIRNHPVYYKQFEERIYALQSACTHTGYGYGYAIDELVYDLEDSI